MERQTNEGNEKNITSSGKVTRYVGCKQKQYFGVLWCLSFLEPFCSSCSADDFSLWPEKYLKKDAKHAFLIFAENKKSCLHSPQHLGPLCQANLGSLQSLTSDHILLFFDALYRLSMNPTLAVKRFPLFQEEDSCYFYPKQSRMVVELWDESEIQRYKEYLLDAHRNKAQYYRELSHDGFLKECGLHSKHVFCATAATSSIEQAWSSLIDEYSCIMPDRSHVHELENLPQEIAMGELLADCVARVRSLDPDFAPEQVVDVGGGNGFLAAAVGERLKCDSLVIDPFFPGHSIDCCPRIWRDIPDSERVRPARRRQFAIRRSLALFKDTTWDADIASDPARTIFVAKHLCGSAIDECLRHLAAQQRLPRILVLAPCCFHRCSFEEYIYPEFLASLLGIEDEMGFRNTTRITDWSKSTYQVEQNNNNKNGKHHKKKTVDHLVPCSDGLAYTVEALLNYGRALWLERQGYSVQRLQYVPNCVTPKNKCLIAVKLK